MTHTIISLVSILLGIIGANATPYFVKDITLGIEAKSILGVFGSVFLIKSLGRLGLNPQAIMASGVADMPSLFLNLAVSFLGGSLLVYIVNKLGFKR